MGRAAAGGGVWWLVFHRFLSGCADTRGVDSKVRKRLKVLINPFGGSGSAVRVFEKSCHPILEAAGCTLDVQTTERSGHATDIARDLDVRAFDALVCCSGDGLPHEVFNGLAKREDAAYALRALAVCQLPGGSGNAMCWNLTGTGEPSLAALAVVKGIRKPLDLVTITQGGERFLSFLSQSFGIIAEVDLGTENLRWMGGARFTAGLLQRVWRQTVYPCDLAVRVAIEGKESIREHYRAGGAGGRERGEGKSAPTGLPRLRFGTVNEPLPGDWELVHHPDMGNFYAGNVSPPPPFRTCPTNIHRWRGCLREQTSFPPHCRTMGCLISSVWMRMLGDCRR